MGRSDQSDSGAAEGVRRLFRATENVNLSGVVFVVSMGSAEDIRAQIAQIRNQLDELLATVLPLCCTERPVDDQAASTRQALEKIKEKEFASVSEVAQLMGCSDSHVRNLVEKALTDQATACPIPFADLDGVRVFPVQELLQWARIAKPKAKKTPKRNRNKSNLAAVES